MIQILSNNGMLVNVFEFLKPSEVLNHCGLVSKTWHEIATSGRLWKIYIDLYLDYRIYEKQITQYSWLEIFKELQFSSWRWRRAIRYVYVSFNNHLVLPFSYKRSSLISLFFLFLLVYSMTMTTISGFSLLETRKLEKLA